MWKSTRETKNFKGKEKVKSGKSRTLSMEKRYLLVKHHSKMSVRPRFLWKSRVTWWLKSPEFYLRDRSKSKKRKPRWKKWRQLLSSQKRNTYPWKFAQKSSYAHILTAANHIQEILVSKNTLTRFINWRLRSIRAVLRTAAKSTTTKQVCATTRMATLDSNLTNATYALLRPISPLKDIYRITLGVNIIKKDFSLVRLRAVARALPARLYWLSTFESTRRKSLTNARFAKKPSLNQETSDSTWKFM